MHFPESIFSELKVVELASVLAGPAVGRFFSELGATVTKIENARTGGDVTRRWKLPGEETPPDLSAYYCSVNWRKTSLLLDLHDAADRQRVFELIAEADILIGNFRATAARKLGLHYEQLREAYPRLIYGWITGYGMEDTRPAFDVVLQAETGFLHMTGEPGRPPVKMPVALIDLLAAHQLKEGILTALWQRERNGKGNLIHVSLYDAAIASLANQATNYLMADYVPQPRGTQHPNIAPYGDLVYSVEGKPLVLAVGTEAHFVGLCTALDIADLAREARFATNAQRVIHRQELLDRLRKITVQRTVKELTQLLDEHDVPFGEINDLATVFTNPSARRLVATEELKNGAMAKSVRTTVFEWMPTE